MSGKYVEEVKGLFRNFALHIELLALCGQAISSEG
jgi:hypothetical protein